MRDGPNPFASIPSAVLGSEKKEIGSVDVGLSHRILCYSFFLSPTVSVRGPHLIHSILHISSDMLLYLYHCYGYIVAIYIDNPCIFKFMRPIKSRRNLLAFSVDTPFSHAIPYGADECACKHQDYLLLYTWWQSCLDKMNLHGLKENGVRTK